MIKKIQQYLLFCSVYIAKAVTSRWFFITVVVFFALQMIWVALSGIYPMLFDEEYHLGIIEIYSHQLSPFITVQPPEASFHGDITRYGSYFFHYLMSFPYALISSLTGDIMTQVIFLRLLCIGFVLAGLVVWRKFLLKAGVSSGIAHSAIAVFTFIPLVPFALAQLNYDSLLFLLVPSLFYLTISAVESKKDTAKWLLWLLSLSAIGSIVKFTLIPIAFACVMVVVYMFIRRNKRISVKVFTKQIKKIPKITLIVSSVLLVVSVAFFLERYAVNLVVYKNVEPKCHQVHTVQECSEYTVWRRDNSWQQANNAKNAARDNPLKYSTGYWVPHIYNDFFVAAAFVYDNDQPLQIRYLPTTMQASPGVSSLRIASYAIATLSLLVVVAAFTLLRTKYRSFVLILFAVLITYTASLWLRNYTDYLKIGAGTAAQGRYFIPLLIPIFAIVGVAVQVFVKKIQYKALLVILFAVLLSQGGGIATYILYSNERWYWLDNRSVISDINQSARSVLKVFIRQ